MLPSAACPRVQSIQNAYNLLNRTYEMALAEVSMREDVGLLAYSPLGQGYLTGKYLDGARPAGARTTLFDRGQRYRRPGAEPAIEPMSSSPDEIRPRSGADGARLRAMSRPFVTSNIIGATTMEQLKTDIASVDVAMTPELEAKIDAIHLLHTNPCP